MSDLLASWYADCAARGFDSIAATRPAPRPLRHRDFDVETERREGWDWQEKRHE